MITRTHSFIYRFIVVLAFFITAACSRGAGKQETKETKEATPVELPMAPVRSSEAPSSGVAGVHWIVPPSWILQPAKPMRVSTYAIPPVPGDAEGGECAVFFFGEGQGGDVRSNIDRWISQFKSDSKAEETSRTVNGIQVTIVAVSGTYLAPSGPMMQSLGAKENYKLLGAIVQAPEGAVFFKTTGPASTMAASEKDFNALVDSIRS